jgi:hypothetical protein
MQSITIDSLIIASSDIVHQTLVETVVAFTLSIFQPQDLHLSGLALKCIRAWLLGTFSYGVSHEKNWKQNFTKSRTLSINA